MHSRISQDSVETGMFLAGLIPVSASTDITQLELGKGNLWEMPDSILKKLVGQ